MKDINKTTSGWMGKVLWIDLKERTSKEIDVRDLLPDHIGARGLGIKMALDYLKPGTKAFDPENLLMFMGGPIAGTLSPYSGRGYVFGVTAQGYPEHFSRSSMGGRWATHMKYCGYDGIIVVNKSEKPCVLHIKDSDISFCDGEKYWGKDTIESQDALHEDFGHHTDAVVIGQAGENRVRVATIHHLVNNVAGQGGFGAVMGDKNLKAIVFEGSQSVRTADPSRLLALRKEVMDLNGVSQIPPNPVEEIVTNTSISWNVNELKSKGDLGEVTAAIAPCLGCSGCLLWRHAKDVPAEDGNTKISGPYKCVEYEAMSWGYKAELEKEELQKKLGRNYRYNIGFKAGFELVNLMNRYGINAWEFNNIQLWLSKLECEGVDVSDLIGMEWKPDDPRLMQRILKSLVFRTGFGDRLAEGMTRVGKDLGGIYEKLSTDAAHGYTTHALGTDVYGFYPYPLWIPFLAQWATDTRDPLSDCGHHYVFIVANPDEDLIADITYKVYGTEYAATPYQSQILSGDLSREEEEDLAYRDKEIIAIWNQNRSTIIGSGVFCDWMFPIFTTTSTDSNPTFGTTTKTEFGDLAMESKILSAATGEEYSQESLDKIGEKIFNMERCFSLLEGRTIRDDFSIADSMERVGGDWIHDRSIDVKRFTKMMERYYDKRGWDEKGIPTDEKLKELGLEYMVTQIQGLRKGEIAYENK